MEIKLPAIYKGTCVLLWKDERWAHVQNSILADLE